MKDKQIQAVRGMHDVLPTDSYKWQVVEKILAEVATNYGLNQIRTPTVEKLELFKRSIGEVTDIVEKEMYQFEDSSHWLALRPENTAGVVRAAIEHGLAYNKKQRLWYIGAQFRRERPQAGRFRQFHQFGVEYFGFNQPMCDVECILICNSLWQRLGIKPKLKLNTIGNQQSRLNHRAALIEFLEPISNQLPEHIKARAETNPLRIFDSKDDTVQNLIKDAPVLNDYLDNADREHFDEVCELLTTQGIEFELDNHLVRGLDYYNRTVFEWVSSNLGAQSSICGGGRYDGLFTHLGGKETPGIGFAIGIERLLNELASQNYQLPILKNIFLISTLETQKTLKILQQIRYKLPDWQIAYDFDGGKLKNQFKRADNYQALIALIIGDSEFDNQQITIKHMQGKTISNDPTNPSQLTIEFERLVDFISNIETGE